MPVLIAVAVLRVEQMAAAGTSTTPVCCSASMSTCTGVPDGMFVAAANARRTGAVDVNGGAFNPLAPFGGYKQSGVGRELGPYGLAEFQQVKAVQR